MWCVLVEWWDVVRTSGMVCVFTVLFYRQIVILLGILSIECCHFVFLKDQLACA